jgi:hypothetical protein
VVPCVVPQREDVDGQLWKDKDERLKAMGTRRAAVRRMWWSWRAQGSVARASGMMQVYFVMLRVPGVGPSAGWVSAADVLDAEQ